MKPKEGYKMMRRLFNKKAYIVLGILCSIFIWLQLGIESYAFTRTTGEVTGSSVKVRASASTEAEVVASVRAGDELDVTDAVTGTDGNTWYKVIVKADEYGYIRSDFVTLEGGAQSPSTTTGTTTTTTTTETTEVTPMENQNGHTNTNNVKVRQQASTTSAEVDRLNQDTVFSITGTAQGVDSKIWYQVSYVDGGKAMTGFIRSDLVTLMEKEEEQIQEEIIEVEEETETEESGVPTPEKNYEAVYTTDENGNYVWYLYDRSAGQRYKVDQLLQVDNNTQEEIDDLSSANFGLKIALIISICLLIMMIVAVVFYLLRIKEDEEENSYRRVNSNSSQTTVRRSQAPVRTQGTARTAGTARNAGTGAAQQTARTQNTAKLQQTVRTQSNAKPQQATTVAKSQNTAQTTARTQNVQQAKPVVETAGTSAQSQQQKTSWKAKNFLEDNDEFEFGFLDFDEDDE